MSDSIETSHTLMCSEVWGGNRKIFRTVQLASVTAWVASVPLNEGEGGGDLHYMSVCDHDLISRVVLADVSGHGRVVSTMAETLQRLMRENINVWDQSDFMRGLNDKFLLNSQNKYATAIVLSFHSTTGRLMFSNAGHLPPLWYHARQQTWGWLEEDDDSLAKKGWGLPIGLIPGTDYRQSVATLEPSDLLVLYTDGVTEAENYAGESLDREQLLKWAREAPTESPEALGQALLKQLESFQGRCRNDDETLIVLQREKASVMASLGNFAVNHPDDHGVVSTRSAPRTFGDAGAVPVGEYELTHGTHRNGSQKFYGPICGTTRALGPTTTTGAASRLHSRSMVECTGL